MATTKLQMIERDDMPAIGEFGPLTVERRAYVAAHRIAASDMHPPDTLVTPSQRQNWRVDEIARMVREAFE